MARITDIVTRSAPIAALAAFLAAACAGVPGTAPAPLPASAATVDVGTAGHGTAPYVTPFSTATLDVLPPAWKPYRLARFKKLTEYQLVPFEGTVALKATADASASGLQHEVVADLREYPWLSWKWMVPALNETANNTLAAVEDSPARIVVAFEGGRDKLPAAEQINYDLGLAIAGHELPYATIMYIWENSLPEGAIITHHFSTRIKMIVAGSGRKDLGIWHEERVNLLEDYRRAFGEEPPHVKSVGIMSDSDNTGARTIAYFGDIRFHRR
jgi:hypothetical protein